VHGPLVSTSYFGYTTLTQLCGESSLMQRCYIEYRMQHSTGEFAPYPGAIPGAGSVHCTRLIMGCRESIVIITLVQYNI